MTEEFVEEDVKSLRTMIGRYGYQNLIKELENIEQVMRDELQSMFKFNIFDIDGKDYIPIGDLVSFLGKLDPYIFDFDVNEIKLEATPINENTFLMVSKLLDLMRELDPNVPAFDLAEVAGFIEDESRKKKSG